MQPLPKRSLSPSVITEEPAISRLSPKYNSTDSINSVLAQFNNTESKMFCQSTPQQEPCHLPPGIMANWAAISRLSPTTTLSMETPSGTVLSLPFSIMTECPADLKDSAPATVLH